jgi:hypothetical protein
MGAACYRVREKRWLPGHGDGADRVFVRSFFIFNTEEARGPRSATEIAMPRYRELTERVPSPSQGQIGLATEVHRHTGAGLLESFFAASLRRELERPDSRVRREAFIPAPWNGEPLGRSFRADTWWTRLSSWK